jgi:hypothetical protein
MSDDTLGKSREQKKNIFLKVVQVLRGIQRERRGSGGGGSEREEGDTERE